MRGRRWTVPVHPDLRPTPDRVRETLFNWLAPVIDGSRCLDLFAGSGALGFEAASRGAAEVVMVERAAPIVRALRSTSEEWGLAGVLRIERADALRWIERGAGDQAFDVVFLDPPFSRDLLAPACVGLARFGWLAPGAHVYLEAASRPGLPPLPAGWVQVRMQRAGEVSFALARVEPPPS